ncbi:hypothetical protein ACFSTE_16875 [Aquimarina hainanensis]|uniref:YbjN domain-containing protein n=2 Tax=Aquimarina hainanensis TaxID=1578017 RepID=A0ABW5NBS4_9FLAO
MKNLLFLFLSLMLLTVHSQDMTNEKLLEIIKAHTDTVHGSTGNWQFKYQNVMMICITDINSNRLRFMSPITESSQLNKELLLDAMTANFHSALDVRYAISNGIVWSVYIHPLRETNTQLLVSAIDQVYQAAVTFGTTFSSTRFLFGGKSILKKNAPSQKQPHINRL